MKTRQSKQQASQAATNNKKASSTKRQSKEAMLDEMKEQLDKLRADNEGLLQEITAIKGGKRPKRAKVAGCHINPNLEAEVTEMTTTEIWRETKFIGCPVDLLLVC